MTKFQEFQERIIQEIGKLNFEIEPTRLYEPINYSLQAGGKRIRPVLTLLACDLFSGNIEKAIKPALALEIFHNFTLLHDDIMDNSNVRRNIPTVHKKWDNNVAILSGDAMMIKSYEFLFDLEPEILKNVLILFNQTAIEVCEGQQYDMDFETSNNVSIDEYINMIRLKTSVLIAGSLKVGALIAGASKKDSDYLYDFGLNIGLAFQLQDDLLDTYGDYSRFGKEIGKDIISNKKTFLLINALQFSDKESRKKLEFWLSQINFDSQTKIKEIKDIYDKLNIKSITEKRINSYFDIAINSLNKISVESNKKSELLAFASSIQQRKF